MYHFFVEPEQIGEKEIQIRGGDVNHIRNVLRMKPGEEITVGSRGKEDRKYRCRIDTIGEEQVTAEIMWAQEANTELPVRIALFQGLPKGDKMEFIIQKAVELGACEIVPVASRRAVVKLDEKKAQAKGKRWNAIAESAAKQSGRTRIPQVRPVMSFQEAAALGAEYDRKLIPYARAEGMEETRRVLDSICPGESVAVFIGPEGGFEEEEIALASRYGFVPITLGRRILRTETAGMALLSVLMFQMEGKDGTCISKGFPVE